MSLTETGLRSLQTVHMRWSTGPWRWKPPRDSVFIMDFQLPSIISSRLRADPSFQIGDVSRHSEMSLFHVKIPCRWRCEVRSFGICMSPWPHRMGSMPMRTLQPVYIHHRNRDKKYDSIFRMLSHMADPFRGPITPSLYQKSIFLPFMYFCLIRLLHGLLPKMPLHMVRHKTTHPNCREIGKGLLTNTYNASIVKGGLAHESWRFWDSRTNTGKL